jgi:peptidoglycan/LPS O-acetylase OafA/YrhL
MNELPKGRIVFLDYMRVFAFISVLVGHRLFAGLTDIANSIDNHITIRLIAEALIPLCNGGAAGIIVFFLTSGYIITHVLQKESATEFMVKRIFRIYPLYIFAVVMEMVLNSIFRSMPIPPLTTIIPRILLIGDFFGTPYALSGVEWTLRIEVMFYALMCVAKAVGLFRHQYLLPYVYAAIAIALFAAPTLPSGTEWSDGYINLYTAFLFCGSCFYLIQTKKASMTNCALCVLLIFSLFLVLIPEVQPVWKNSNYAAFAVLIFFTGFIAGDKLSDGKVLIFLSELTYSVYLFHNWAWNYIYQFFLVANIHIVNLKLQTVIVLLICCYVASKTVEKFGIQAGKSVLKFMKQRGKATDEKKIASEASSRLT